MADCAEEIAFRLTLLGRVQGVGFRPFVFRLASRHGLHGWVKNAAGAVEILIQGTPDAVAAFQRGLQENPPPLARPRLESVRPHPVNEALTGFAILESTSLDSPRAVLPPDLFACDDCLAEMGDPANRRHGYPFINCTQCGPRYTLIVRLPYDRPNTAMASFALCPACTEEYENPLDRRFHAQPLACPSCGPRLTFRAKEVEISQTSPALAATTEALRQGGIVAVKGIGGYHLLCDAANPVAVARLRQRKPRPHKPLAVMVPQQGADGLDQVRVLALPEPLHERLLCDPLRPVVLTPLRREAALVAAIAPGLNEVGLMLPYSPLHHLLLTGFGAPLVATSANISGEPVLTDGAEVEARLGGLADAFLHHDRPILRPADDPVFRVVAGLPLPIRLGRGNAPAEGRLPFSLARPLLAVGGENKNSVALAWEERVVLSPHIGDLETPRGMEIFRRTGEALQQLYGVRAEFLVHDRHPGYHATRWAEQQGLPLLAVGHHHAHASALVGEHDPLALSLIFVWDAAGLGDDGRLWGGEAFLGQAGAWRRVATFRPFRLPGGEKAARQPWRSALGLCWEAGLSWPQAPQGMELLRQAWQRGVNAPVTHAVGRLLDGAAALIGVVRESSFEGQAPMWLESAAEGVEIAPMVLPMEEQEGVLVCDWRPLLPVLMAPTLSVVQRAGLVHVTLAHVLARQAEVLRERWGVGVVGMSGGVFQNRRLTGLARALLEERGFQVWLAREVPCNDGGLAYGQAVEVAAVLRGV